MPLLVFTGGCERCGSDEGRRARADASLAAVEAVAAAASAREAAEALDAGELSDAGDAGEADASRLLTKSERTTFARFREKVALGRKATAEKRWSDADDFFTAALVARPTDARTRAERGYARLLADDLDHAAEDFDRALASGVDAKLGGQVFFNLGLLREKKKLPDSARAAFAISNTLSPSEAAKAKLGGRSMCTADVEEQPPASDDLQAVATFEALAVEVQPVKDLGGPKASVCIASHSADGEPDVRNTCSGDPPWGLSHHHIGFTESQYFVVPAKPGPGLLFYRAWVGGWPAHCTNLPFPTATLAGDFLRISSTFDGRMAALDETQEIKDSQMPCADVLGYNEDVFYETKTGKRVLRIYMPSGVAAPKVTTSKDGRLVSLAGAGCDRTIALTTR